MKSQQWPRSRTALLASLVLVFCASLVWYHLPVPVESVDRLAYCGCGYSAVSFRDGRVTMVRFHHDSVKPGEQIGTYRVLGNRVELDITHNGESRKETLAIDNIGILASGASLRRYYALDGSSPKVYIHFGIERLRSSLSGFWSG